MCLSKLPREVLFVLNCIKILKYNDDTMLMIFDILEIGEGGLQVGAGGGSHQPTCSDTHDLRLLSRTSP